MGKLGIEPIFESKVHILFFALRVESAEKWWLAGESRPMASATGLVVRDGRRLKRIGLDSENPSRNPCLERVRTKSTTTRGISLD